MFYDNRSQNAGYCQWIMGRLDDVLACKCDRAGCKKEQEGDNAGFTNICMYGSM